MNRTIILLQIEEDGRILHPRDFPKDCGDVSPIYIYKVRLLTEDASPFGPCIYEYENEDGGLLYTTSLYEINGQFKNRYLILKTNSNDYSDDLLFSSMEEMQDELLKLNVECFPED